jgi:hypothetical protein
MTIEMNVKTAKEFYESLDAADLRKLDSQGGRLAWCPADGFVLSLGESSDRAPHEWLDGLVSTEIRTAAQEFATKPEQVLAELIADAEAHLCALDAEVIDAPRERPAE